MTEIQNNNNYLSFIINLKKLYKLDLKNHYQIIHNCKKCRTKDPTSVKEMMEFCLKCYEYNIHVLN